MSEHSSWFTSELAPKLDTVASVDGGVVTFIGGYMRDGDVVSRLSTGHRGTLVATDQPGAFEVVTRSVQFVSTRLAYTFFRDGEETDVYVQLPIPYWLVVNWRPEVGDSLVILGSRLRSVSATVSPLPQSKE